MNRDSLGDPNQDEFEPGSGGTVLRNVRGLTDPAEIGRVEAALLVLAQARSYGRLEPSTPLTVALIRELHRSWLAPLYGFAGELRRVNLSKGAVHFAPVAYIDSTLRELDVVLAVEAPCEGMAFERAVPAIARVHVELVLAHPFREGNGRLARWVADLMALQAGLPPLAWGFDTEIEARRDAYLAALRRGFAGIYTPTEALVREALERALRSAEDPPASP